MHLPTLTAPDWPLTFRVLSQVDTVVAGCIITGGLFFLVAWVSDKALGRTGLGGGDIKLAGLSGPRSASVVGWSRRSWGSCWGV